MAKESNNDNGEGVHEELPTRHGDPLIRFLHKIIRLAVRALAVLMVLVILWGTADVVYVLYTRLTTPPVLLLQVEDILQTFGAFMAVLIAIEIFINIRLYLGSQQLPIELVVATAIMAVARKIIILDFATVSANYVFAMAGVVVALGITYWLVSRRPMDTLY